MRRGFVVVLVGAQDVVESELSDGPLQALPKINGSVDAGVGRQGEQQLIRLREVVAKGFVARARHARLRQRHHIGRQRRPGNAPVEMAARWVDVAARAALLLGFAPVVVDRLEQRLRSALHAF